MSSLWTVGFVLSLCFLTVIKPVFLAPIEHSVDIPDALHDHFHYASSLDVGSGGLTKRADPATKIINETAKALLEKIAQNQVESGIKVDIQPGNAMIQPELVAPPAYHIEQQAGSSLPASDPPQTFASYPSGIGAVMWNGCYGTDYKANDPCYEARVPTQSTCVDMMEGAGFIGVGFDGRGAYSPDSRKMSIIQRNCAAFGSYQGEDVPDTMNVHGIYETKSTMMTYETREEYSQHLQTEAGVSGSYMFFSAGVTAAYGTSSSSRSSMHLSEMNFDIIRYEIFKDEVKASDLSTNFLKEFMDLPMYYLTPGAPFKLQDFVDRWGTHYIKSAVFGGRLTLRKVASASYHSSVSEFAVEAKVDYDKFFASFHAKSSTKGGSSYGKQTQYSAMSIEALGGDQEIAAIVADGGTPTTRTDLVNWLRSIPKYPKPFKFLMAPITDLLYFQPSDLFPTGNTDWDCNTRSTLDPTTGKKYYTITRNIGGRDSEVTLECKFTSKKQFMQEIALRRKALERAIAVYLSEGLISTSKMSIPPGAMHCDLELVKNTQNTDKPDWNYMTSGKSFSVMFDLANDITGGYYGKTIETRSVVQMHFYSNYWFVEDAHGKVRMADGFNNGNSGVTSNKKISIQGLVLTFIPESNILILQDADYIASIAMWPALDKDLQNRFLAKVGWPSSLTLQAVGKKFLNQGIASFPCNLHWSNVQSMDIHKSGVCLYFSASSLGTIYTTFASVPKDKRTWYFVKIGTDAVSIYKYNRVLTETSLVDARGIGDVEIRQNYFVCLEIKNGATLIEYGKFFDDKSKRTIYLSYLDSTDPLQPVFYAYGGAENDVNIFEMTATERQAPTSINCGTGTKFDAATDECKLHCHEECDPTFGCMIPESGPPLPSLCQKCTHVTKPTPTGPVCTITCDNNVEPVDADGRTICPCFNFNSACVSKCPDGYVASDNSDCEDIDECESNPCKNGGACTNLVNSFQCDCTNGWSGAMCLFETTKVCAQQNPCQNGGVCTDVEDGYICTCSEKYNGKNCEITDFCLYITPSQMEITVVADNEDSITLKHRCTDDRHHLNQPEVRTCSKVLGNWSSPAPVCLRKYALSYRKAAEMSSVAAGSDASKAVDGNPNMDLAMCAVSNNEDEPYWRVDLGEDHEINSVYITTIEGRDVRNAEVGIDTSHYMSVPYPCTTLTQVSENPTKFNCHNEVARYVRVKAIATSWPTTLRLCEVEVVGTGDQCWYKTPANMVITKTAEDDNGLTLEYKCTDTTHELNQPDVRTCSKVDDIDGTNWSSPAPVCLLPHNLSYGKFARMSSAALGNTVAGSSAIMALDGDPTTDLRHCSVTNSESQPWWRVDLGDSYMVSAVYIVTPEGDRNDVKDAAQVRLGDHKEMDDSTTYTCLDARFEDPYVTFQCNLVDSRKRYVQIKGTRDAMTLKLCEVQVVTRELCQYITPSQMEITVVADNEDSITLKHRCTDALYHLNQPEVRTCSKVLGNWSSPAPVCLRQDTLSYIKAAKMSSVAAGSDASKAVDGNPNMDLTMCAVSNSEDAPSWQVDLGEDYEINSVYITTIEGSNVRNAEVGIDTSQYMSAPYPCTTLTQVSENPTKFDCKNEVARYVRVKLTSGPTTLRLCEVEVVGTGNQCWYKTPANMVITKTAEDDNGLTLEYKCTDTTHELNQPDVRTCSKVDDTNWSSPAPVCLLPHNLSYGKFARMSSAAQGTLVASSATMALDGDPSTDLKHCAVTNSESQPWWMVDLGDSYMVSVVFIVTEGDRADVQQAQVRLGDHEEMDDSTTSSCSFRPFSNGPIVFECYLSVDLPKRYVQIKGTRDAMTLRLCEVQVATRGCAGTKTITVPPGQVETLTSPNYPDKYLNYEHCKWLISTDQGRRLKMEVTDFETELNWDKFWYGYGLVPLTDTVAEKSGNVGPFDYTSPGSEMWLRWVADYSNRRKGWSLTISVL